MFAGGMSAIRTDDLAATPIAELMKRNPSVDRGAVDDVMYGCTNQAGEDNRNVARMAGLLAGLPPEVPGVTFNRLCGSGMDAVGSAARAIKVGEAELEALRRCVSRGRPFGNPNWVADTARRLGLEPTLRHRGRPKKQS